MGDLATQPPDASGSNQESHPCLTFFVPRMTATTADLLALFMSSSMPESVAVATLNKILAQTPKNKPQRQLHAAIELARRQMLATLMDSPAITSSNMTLEYMQMHFLGTFWRP